MTNKLYDILTWEHVRNLIKQQFGVNFIKVDDFFREDTEWFPLDDWENANSLEIISLFNNLKTLEGKLIIITDASYKKELGPFHVDAFDLNEFVIKHKQSFGETFLDTDILILSVDLKKIWMFHHEGVYALIDFN
ncbi:hypothetical protein SRRS_19220 [Sporomusa rhizae]|uniref:hypothetical protein n=1 Tax=Sporomusa rhizae TaxID=357999 RepID=UPI00352B3DE1